MIGFKIGLGMVFVTVAALLGDNQPKIFVMNLCDGVICVAVDADRQLLVGLGYQRTMNRLLELVDNTDMALVAGVNDVITINA